MSHSQITPAASARQVTMAQLSTLTGTTLGPSGAIAIPQSRIDRFAAATEDRQWLHVDPQRAARGPFSTTIAHGYLTLSLGTALFWSMLDVTDAGQVINYGVNKVRFPAPVAADSRLSLTARIAGVDPIHRGCQLTVAGTFSVENQSKPVCVAEIVLRYYEAEGH